jgi:hypothetical protein
MNITIERIIPYTTERYPYNCRVDLCKCTLSQYDRVLSWTKEQKIPCSWTWTENRAVYMDDKYATLLMLRWSS